MSYIGVEPKNSNFTVCDAISVVNGQATYSLTKNSVAVYPEQASNCLVVLNGILQTPNTSFSISSNNIVFASNLQTGDSIDSITVLGSVNSVGVPSDNTVSLAKLTATGTKDATTFLRGDNTFASAGGTNTPAFAVKLSGDQTISNDTVTKITFDSEIYDTDNAFASNKFTVPSGKAGKYFINLQSKYHVTTDYRGVATYIYKNGSSIEQIRMRVMYNSTLFNDGETQLTATGVLDLSEGDYIEGYGYIFSPNGGTLKILADCTMTGFKLI